MGVRIIHFGWDGCYRLAVLRRAGYQVTEAGNLAELSGELRAAGYYDAVVVSEDSGMDLREVLMAIRDATKAPAVLFRGSRSEFDGQSFELVIDRTLSPQEWLRAMASVIVRYRMRWQAAD